MARVFTVHPVEQDISAANVFGTIEYVNDAYVYKDQVDRENGEIPDDVMQKIWKVADGFEPDSDFILIVGDHLQMMALTAIVAIYNDKFRVLRFDRLRNIYYPVVISTQK